MKLDWHGPKAIAAIRARLATNLYDADEAILSRARSLIDTPGPPASSPGSPPNLDSQRLHDSLYGEVDEAGLRSRVGSTEEHAPHLEIGTDRMAARPFLSRSAIEAADDTARELAK